MITANEVKQKQQEHNSRIQVNEDLVEQVTHELMSNDEFVKECDAVMDKSITKQVEQAVADDNNDTDHFYISMTDLADRGEFWLANDNFMVADGKTGRLLFKYLPPILKKLHVEHRQEWYRRETFTLRRLILKPLAKELNKQMTKHWHIKLAEMGFYKNDDDPSYMVAYGRVSELITHYLPPILSELDVENDKWFIRDLSGNATDVLVKTKLVRKLRDTVNDQFKQKVFQLKNTGYFDGNSYKSMV